MRFLADISFKARKHKAPISLLYNPFIVGFRPPFAFFCKMGTLPKRQKMHLGLPLLFLFWVTLPALGIVWHPDGEPNMTNWMDRPPEEVVGRWGWAASCVAISANCVITTQHQSGGVGSWVEIAGNRYMVSQVYNHNTADLRIAKLYAANLHQFIDIYEDDNEISKGIIMGGYGDGRGDLLQTEGITYGYEWDDSSNTIQRWATNRVEAAYIIDVNSNGHTYTTEALVADFDGLNEGNSTEYEGAIADHDSGSGWFIKSDGSWKLAAISCAVERRDESWFRNKDNPHQPDPDKLYAVRISSYATWISQTMPQYIPGDLTGDDWVDLTDFAVLMQYWSDTTCEFPDWCDGADFEPDGDVDWDDLAFLLDNWLNSQQY